MTQLSDTDKANVASALIKWFKSRNIEPDSAHDIMAIVMAGEFWKLNPKERQQKFKRLETRILELIEIVAHG